MVSDYSERELLSSGSRAQHLSNLPSTVLHCHTSIRDTTYMYAQPSFFSVNCTNFDDECVVLVYIYKKHRQDSARVSTNQGRICL